ncbi:MAG: hypothetical protein KBS52_01920 [Clostridiales bacterium]|nr:hypothetical protein [Candidatus Equinaster intestinalis]
MDNTPDLKNLTAEQKKKQLFLNQKQLLDTFLSHGAITKAQYDKSFGDLKEKMGFNFYLRAKSNNLRF